MPQKNKTSNIPNRLPFPNIWNLFAYFILLLQNKVFSFYKIEFVSWFTLGILIFKCPRSERNRLILRSLYYVLTVYIHNSLSPVCWRLGPREVCCKTI